MRNIILLFIVSVLFSACDTGTKKGHSSLDVYGASKPISIEEVEQNLDVQNRYAYYMRDTGDYDLDSIANQLRTDERVSKVFIHPEYGGIDIVYKNGMLGGIRKPYENSHIKGGVISPKYLLTHSLVTKKYPRALNNIVLKNKKVLSLALQYWDWGDEDDVPKITKILENDGGYEIRKSFQNELDGSLDMFTSLERYGLILLSSHGDSFGAKNKEMVVIHSNTKRSRYFDNKYASARNDGSLVYFTVGDDVVYFVTPKFIDKYNKNFDKTIVYMSICKGAYNKSMANAFLKNGASVYLGYSDYVAVDFTVQTGTDFFRRMLSLDSDSTYNNVAESFRKGLHEDMSDPDPAEFKKFSKNDLIAIKDLSSQNGLLDSTLYEGIAGVSLDDGDSISYGNNDDGYLYDSEADSYDDGYNDGNFSYFVNHLDDFVGDSGSSYVDDALSQNLFPDTIYDDTTGTFAGDMDEYYDTYLNHYSGDISDETVGASYDDGHVNIAPAHESPYTQVGKAYYREYCASCHGAIGDKRAYHVSEYIRYFSTDENLNALYNYKYYGQNLYGYGSVMTQQVQSLDDDVLKEIAAYIGSV